MAGASLYQARPNVPVIPLLDSTNNPLILHVTSSLHTHDPSYGGQNSKAHDSFNDTTASKGQLVEMALSVAKGGNFPKIGRSE